MNIELLSSIKGTDQIRFHLILLMLVGYSELFFEEIPSSWLSIHIPYDVSEGSNTTLSRSKNTVHCLMLTSVHLQANI